MNHIGSGIYIVEYVAERGDFRYSGAATIYIRQPYGDVKSEIEKVRDDVLRELKRMRVIILIDHV